MIYELQRDDFKWKIRANPTDALSGSPRIISMSDSLTIATLDILNVVWFLIPGTQGNLQGDWQKVSISKKPVHISIGIDKTLLIVDEENKINVRIPSVEERQDLTKMRGINVHAGQIVRISSGSNMRHRRLWTHAGSAYDPFGTNNPPDNPLEVLVGSDSKEDNREDVGCFFSIIDYKNQKLNYPIKFNDEVRIVSHFSIEGHKNKAGFLGKSWNWWISKPSTNSVSFSITIRLRSHINTPRCISSKCTSRPIPSTTKSITQSII